MKANTSYITLTNPENGEQTEEEVLLVLNPKKLMFIERDFPEAKTILSMAVSPTGAMNLDMLQLFKVVYVAYRLAHMNEYLTFDEFQDAYEFDMEEGTQIFYSMISKEFRSNYLEALRRASKSKDSSKQ